MFNQKKIAIMGTGNIASVMAKTIKKMRDVKVYAVGSRSLDKAQEFAKEYGVKKAYGSYEELVSDPKIDLVYIATPHSEHYENIKLCIEHGVPVLCEKAFTANAAQAKEVLALAKEKNVFVTEAIWTRYMPLVTTIKGLLNSGIIGQPSVLQCNLGYHLINIPRMVKPELCGGALLDLGVYTLNFASMMFGDDIERIDSTCTLTSSGVDATDSITITYRDGKVAVLNCTMLGISDRRGVIYGTNGYMVIENINNFESITIYDQNRNIVKRENAPKQITGYEYQVSSALGAIEKGNIECWEMPHAEIIKMMEIMDGLRAKWGVKYPCKYEEGYVGNKVTEYSEVDTVEEDVITTEEAPEIFAACVDAEGESELVVDTVSSEDSESASNPIFQNEEEK